ncbi:hypothetical protein NL676_020854 [Syzygium grande]|nr:hypothetical protein NL676_020854 [Syzygium grande]
MCPERRESPLKEASELRPPCGARAPSAAAAAAAFSTAGEPCSSGDPSAGAIISAHIRGDGRVAPPMGMSEWVDWSESKWGSSATGEDVGSPIAKYDAGRDRVSKKLEDLEKGSSVSMGAGDSGAGFGCNSENLSVFESFEARVPALYEDCLRDGDGNAFSTSLENSAAGGGSLGVDSTPISSHLEGCGFDPDNFLSVSGDRVSDGDPAIGGGCSGEEPMLCDECGFNPDEFISLLEDCAGDRDRDSFLALPEISAIGGGGSSGEEPMLCNLEECGFNPDEFLSLLEDCIDDGDRDSFLTLPENSTIGGGSSGEGEETMLCDLEGYANNFLLLEDLDVPL